MTLFVFSYAFAKSRTKKFETLPRGPLLALRLRVSSTANSGLKSKYSHRFWSGRYHVNRSAVVPFLRMYLTVEGFSYLMHASTSAFPFLRIHDSCVRCLPEEVIHCYTPSAPSLCVAHSVPRKADGVFAFGPRRPLGGAPSGGQEDGPRPSFCFALPKARLSFLFLCFGPTSAQLHCGRFKWSNRKVIATKGWVNARGVRLGVRKMAYGRGFLRWRGWLTGGKGYKKGGLGCWRGCEGV